MENILAYGRIYLMVIVFFSASFLGLMADVSLPMLAIRSIVITGIVGILSHLFVKYIVSVTRTVSSEELDPLHNSVSPKVDRTTGKNNK